MFSSGSRGQLLVADLEVRPSRSPVAWGRHARHHSPATPHTEGVFSATVYGDTYSFVPIDCNPNVAKVLTIFVPILMLVFLTQVCSEDLCCLANFDQRPSRVKKRVQGEEDKEAAKKKRRKARSCSSSSSSNSSEERAGKAAKSSKMKVDKSYEKMLDITVSAVKNGEEKVKELSKNTKKSQQKVETDCQNVCDRVGEMTIAVQVIMENLNSVNDVNEMQGWKKSKHLLRSQGHQFPFCRKFWQP